MRIRWQTLGRDQPVPPRKSAAVRTVRTAATSQIEGLTPSDVRGGPKRRTVGVRRKNMRAFSGRKAFRIGFLVLSLLIAGTVLAITVFEHDVTCPICQTQNKVMMVGSWGSYACRPEGEFDLVPCPIAYTGSLWSCRKCKFTALESDIRVPNDKIAAVREFLDTMARDIEVWRPEVASGWRPKVDDQLFIAQGVYRIVGRDNVFWAEFYRVAGFFAAREGKHQRAIGLRVNALRTAEELIADPARAVYRKEDLLVAGAMAARIGDKERASKYLRAVKAARYAPPNYDEDGLGETRSDMNTLAVRILRSLE